MTSSSEKSRKIYIDTNVYLDLFLNRKGKYLDFSESASRIFTRAKGCEFEVIASDFALHELSKRFPYLREDFIALKYFLGRKAVRIAPHSLDRLLAKQFFTHRADALHIALAVRSRADCIVTRNVKDFADSPVPVVTPESL